VAGPGFETWVGASRRFYSRSAVSPRVPSHPTWARSPPVTCANGPPTACSVTRRPRPFRRVPRGLASGGAKVERKWSEIPARGCRVHRWTRTSAAPIARALPPAVTRSFDQFGATIGSGVGSSITWRSGGGSGLRRRPPRPRPGCLRQPLTTANAPSTAGSHAAAQPSATSSQHGSASASNRSLRATTPSLDRPHRARRRPRRGAVRATDRIRRWLAEVCPVRSGPWRGTAPGRRPSG
jgi:hypothetical protein